MEPWPSDVQLFQPYEVTIKRIYICFIIWGNLYFYEPRNISVFQPKASSLGWQIAQQIATDLKA